MKNKKGKLKIIQWDKSKYAFCLIHYFHYQNSLTGKITSEIIDKLWIVNDKTMLCWRNLRLSTKMVDIYGIEDHLLNQIKNIIELDASLKILLNRHINFVYLIKIGQLIYETEKTII